MKNSIEQHAENYLKNKEIFEFIEGWCRLEQFFELELIFSYLDNYKIQGDIIEAGVFTGKSAGIFYNYIRENEKLKLIDWEFNNELIYKNIKKLLLDKNKKIIYEKYNQDSFCLYNFPKNSAKFIHIDAGHSYDNCWNDLNASKSLIKDYGIIVVDDFFELIYPQVTHAVYNYISDENNELKLFLVAGNKAYICKKQNFKIIIQYIIKNFKYYISLINEPYYLNKSSTFSDNSALSIINIGDNKDIKFYRGLDENNLIFPMDF